MEWLPAIAGGVAAVPLGWYAARYQHLLYRQAEFRAAPLRGGTWWRAKPVAGLAMGLTTAIALRPDHYGAEPALLTALFAAVLIVLSSTDFERRLIPNRLIHPALAGALVAMWAWPDRSVSDCLVGGGFGLLVGAAMFALGLVVGTALGVKATPFGLGDVRLIVLLGLLLGWPAVMTALFMGVILAGLPALVMIVLGRGRSVFSYGPYLAGGGLYALLWFDLVS